MKTRTILLPIPSIRPVRNACKIIPTKHYTNCTNDWLNLKLLNISLLFESKMRRSISNGAAHNKKMFWDQFPLDVYWQAPVRNNEIFIDVAVQWKQVAVQWKLQHIESKKGNLIKLQFWKFHFLCPGFPGR